jgi:pimeloyl-ACP methyl ester carboxylesterase
VKYVTSKDGTRIAYETMGVGPPMVVVHGTLNDRRGWAPVLPLLAQQYTVYAMDRRGRGESGPNADHAIEREFEDVAAVIEAAGGVPVALVGHSFGAHAALGAAALVPERVRHLVLYEPPTPGPIAKVAFMEFATTVKTGDLAGGVQVFMEAAVGLSTEAAAAMSRSPAWPYLVSFAETLPVEGKALIEYEFDPARFGSLKMPALFLVGSETDALLGEVLRRLLPHMPQAKWVEFEGHGHVATLTAPHLFAETVLSFLRS